MNFVNQIFYQTKTYFTNTGDALINHALISKLREYGVLHANCSREVPETFLNELGVRPEEREVANGEVGFIKSVLNSAVQAKKCGDRVFVVSGLGDMYGGNLRLALRNLATGLVFPVFRLFGVQLVRIGRSVGPMTKLMMMSEWVRGLFLSYNYVRDSKSLARCRKMGIKKVALCPDMSWLYQANHEEKINQTNAVMVNLRNAIFDDVEQEFIDATLSKCEEVLDQLNVLLSGEMQVCVAYQIQEDAEFSQMVAERFKNKYPVKYIDHQLSLKELDEAYGQVDFHISNRMHSLLAGYKYGSLPIALIDAKRHTKIAATFEDCGLTELIADICKPGERINGLVEKRERWIHRLVQCEKERNCEINKVLDIIFSERKGK